MIEYIEKIQGGDIELFKKILLKFDKLLWKYSYNSVLEPEDMHSELTLKLYIFSLKVDLEKFRSLPEYYLISYFIKVIKNSYININKHASKNNCISSIDIDDYMSIENNFDIPLEIDEMLSKLTKKESFVVRMIFFYGFSSTEIAKMNNVSPQAINQIKKRGLKKMKEYY